MEIELNVQQVFTLMDWINDGDGGVNAITLTYGDGAQGHGLYVYMTEYPEEGATLVAPSGKPSLSTRDSEDAK